MLMRKRTPSRSATACASPIICRQIAAVPGSPATLSKVAQVRAEMGLQHRLPQSFTQISLRSCR